MTLTTRTRNTRRRDLSANYSRSFPRRRCPTDSSIAPDGSGIKPVSKENNRELFSLTFVSTFDIREVEPSPLDDNTEGFLTNSAQDTLLRFHQFLIKSIVPFGVVVQMGWLNLANT